MSCPKGTLPQPLDMALRIKARQLWEAGESYGSVSSELDVAIPTLKNWRKRDSWQRKSESSELAIVPADSEEIEIPETLQEQADVYERNMREVALKFSHHAKNLPAPEIQKAADKIHRLDSASRKALHIDQPRPPIAIQIGILAQPYSPRLQKLELPSD